jgi:hypothetical protein
METLRNSICSVGMNPAGIEVCSANARDARLRADDTRENRGY